MISVLTALYLHVFSATISLMDKSGEQVRPASDSAAATPHDSFVREFLRDFRGIAEPRSENNIKIEEHPGVQAFFIRAGTDPEKNARSLQDAIDKSDKGGNTLITLEVGNYRGHIKFPPGSKNIRIQAESNKEKPVFDMSELDGSESDAIFHLKDATNISIDGLEFRGFNSSRKGEPAVGIQVEGNGQDIQLSNNYFHEFGMRNADDRNGSQAISVLGTEGTRSIKNLKITNNRVQNMNLGQHEALTVSGNVENFTIANNTISDVNNIGIDVAGGWLKGVPSARFGVIKDNSVSNIDTDRNLTYPRGVQSAGGIYVDGAENILISNNTVKNTNRGIEIGCENKGHSASRIRVESNILVENHHAAITVGAGDKRHGSTLDVWIQNNLFQANGADGRKGIVKQLYADFTEYNNKFIY